MPRHTHSWSCLREMSGKLYCTQQVKDGRATIVKDRKEGFPAKSLLFPNRTKFSQIFSKWSFEGSEGLPVQGFRGESGGYMQIGSYVRNDGPRVLYAAVKDDVFQVLKKSLVLIDGDSTYFNFVNRGKGKTLVTVKYNKILGDRWIAIIDTSSIPKPKR